MAGPFEKGAILVARWGLLGVWFCVDRDEDRERIIDEVRTHFPAVARCLIPDRLFGGFPCGDDPDRRHILWDAGAYTYTTPEANRPLTEAERRERWGKLFNPPEGDNGFIGGGPFTDDVPVSAIAAEAK